MRRNKIRVPDFYLGLSKNLESMKHVFFKKGFSKGQCHGHAVCVGCLINMKMIE